ncbi:hypothetical protein Q7P35_005293 [Cladosporium inversicolor]
MNSIALLGSLLLSQVAGQSDPRIASLVGFTNVSDPYYGQSPPVYPTPEGNGGVDPKWQDAYAKARDLVLQMTIDEKVNMTNGHTGHCVGNTPSIERLGIPPLCFADGPSGIRGQEFVSAFSAQMSVGATFDRSLMRRFGDAMGSEYYKKGINVALLPVAGPLGRVARGGRNWEGFGADPYLSGAGMEAVTLGVQERGVIVQSKHWLLNEQEYRRNPGSAGEAMSSNVDDRTIHELYVFPFMDSLKAGAASIMCSYQRANNSYGCQNSKLLNGILKTELGFQGFVTSDWYAQHAGVASANAGMDLVMPNAAFWGDNLTEAVNNGSVAETRLNDMATRILAAWYFVGQDEDYPEVAVAPYTQQHPIVEARGNNAALIREIGAAGSVLVKNVNNALPLKDPRYLTVYGYDARVGDSPWEDPARFGGGYAVNFGWNTQNGTLITGGGSGTSTPGYLVSPFEAIQRRLIENQGIVRWDFASINPPIYANSEACLVFINAYASEAFDRVSLQDEFSDQLVKNVATNCSNTIVVIHNAGIRTVDEWIEHENVTAVIYAGLPGQESGNSIVDILYGDVSPSGRMPFTIAKNESDYGHLLNATISSGPYPQSNFTEGLYIDYRHFDKYNITPRYEFGFGLSYTTFSYADLSVKSLGGNTNEYPTEQVPVPQGGPSDLWEVLYEVTIDIENTGDVDAKEVPQLYVNIATAPAKQLRGFEAVHVNRGATEKVTFSITRRDLSIWDVVAQKWKLQSGEYPIYVGASSRDIRLTGTITV